MFRKENLDKSEFNKVNGKSILLSGESEMDRIKLYTYPYDRKEYSLYCDECK